MVKLKGICFIQDSNGNIIFPKNGEIEITKELVFNSLWDKDIVITDDDILELVEIEMNEGSHENELYGNETPVELKKYFLENVIIDSYSEFIKGKFDDKNLNTKSLDLIKDLVVEEIKRVVENDFNSTKGLENEVEDLLERLQQDVISYVQDFNLQNEISFDVFLESEKLKTQIDLMNKIGHIDLDLVENEVLKSRTCEVKKAIIYSKYNDEIVTRDILYKRNLDNSITIFKKVVE